MGGFDPTKVGPLAKERRNSRDTEKEKLATILAINRQRKMLEGKPITIYADNEAVAEAIQSTYRHTDELQIRISNMKISD